jgi:hypothetical protein
VVVVEGESITVDVIIIIVVGPITSPAVNAFNSIIPVAVAMKIISNY